jgi:hypothetical protein
VNRSSPVQFRADEEMERRLSRRGNPGLVAKRDLLRYHRALEHALGEMPLSKEDLTIVARVLRTPNMPHEPSMLAGIVAAFGDAELGQRLARLTYFQALAIIDAAETA